MQTPIIQYQQNGQKFLSLVLSLEVIDKISNVLVYGKVKGGYQRAPNTLHLNKLKNYALSESTNFILPTSIILGCDSADIIPNLKSSNGFETLTLDLEEKKFRVVDGQHRIYGLLAAAEKNPQITNFLFPVIIIITDENRRSIELEVFTDINSKSKRINTDLAQLAKYDYQIKEHIIKEEDIWEHIGVKTAFYLKELQNDNVWQHGIKFNIHSENSLGIIGITIFTQSIKPIIIKYLELNNYTNKNNEIFTGEELIEYCKKASDEIGKFLDTVWNKIIRLKWNGAFKNDLVMGEDNELVKILYSKNYLIQKGLGVKSLNPIIGKSVSTHGLNNSAVEEIKKIIFESNVKIEDWRNGGAFAGFNSESGFGKIKRMILNEESVPSYL